MQLHPCFASSLRLAQVSHPFHLGDLGMHTQTRRITIAYVLQISICPFTCFAKVSQTYQAFLLFDSHYMTAIT